MPNIVELSHIIVDKGMFRFMITCQIATVQEAVEHLYQQLSDDKPTESPHSTQCAPHRMLFLGGLEAMIL